MKSPLSFAVLALLTVAACAPGGEPGAAPSSQPRPVAGTADSAAGQVPYDFTRPTATFELPAALREISGVTVLPGGQLAAVQDEQGVLYTLDPQSGAIVAERRFAGPGDYEDLVHAAGSIWVLQSSGTLLELPDGGGEPRQHETPLKKKCDAEGLAFDRAQGRLLIACKEAPGGGLDEDAARAIYAFELGTHQLAPAPALVLNRSALDGAEIFKPSALAVHPATGDLYVLSSVRKAIAVVGSDGRVRTVVSLPEASNVQPEGIVFASDGTLYVSNEGGDGTAVLHRFSPRP